MYCENLNCGSCVNSLVCLINKSMFQMLAMSGSLYQGETSPSPHLFVCFNVDLGHCSDNNIYYE